MRSGSALESCCDPNSSWMLPITRRFVTMRELGRPCIGSLKRQWIAAGWMVLIGELATFKHSGRMRGHSEVWSAGVTLTGNGKPAEVPHSAYDWTGEICHRRSARDQRRRGDRSSPRHPNAMPIRDHPPLGDRQDLRIWKFVRGLSSLEQAAGQ
jgi:hypothetical protein